MFNTYKVYGKKKVVGNGDYLIVNYKEYLEDGQLLRTGTEDFSRQRWEHVSGNSAYYKAMMPSGRINKAGKTMWEQVGCIVIGATKDTHKGKAKIARETLKRLYPDAQIRIM